MTDIAAAYAALRARAEAEVSDPATLLFQDENAVLPDDPAAFVYFELVTERGAFIEIGGGRGSNTYRNGGEWRAYVFVPIGQGLPVALGLAEPIASLFRSWRGSGVVCDGADVHPVGEGEGLVPPGLASAAGSYSCAVMAARLHFHQTG